MYSRYQNVAAGKFVAAQEDLESDDYNAEEWENLNDIEKAAQTVGVQLRDTANNFRDFDEVLQEIADQWDSLSDVQKSGLATSFAGTRQRE